MASSTNSDLTGLSLGPQSPQVGSARDAEPGGTAKLLEVTNVSKSFGGLAALRNISMAVDIGKIVGLIGPNGSGKSTLFNIITGFERADAGSVALRGERIDDLLPNMIAKRGLMRTFQLSQGGMKLTAIENLLVTARDHEEHRLLRMLIDPLAVIRRERGLIERAREILKLLGLQDVGNEYLGNLSGGQRKLIDIGRMLMARPKICLFDEPTAGVNPRLIRVILNTLKEMNRHYGFTILLVEHNMRVVNDLCDYVHVLSAGELIAAGTPAAVQVDHRVIASYMGARRAAAPPGRSPIRPVS